MDIYASIDIRLLEIFREKWISIGKLTYNKFIEEVLKCIILSEALYNKKCGFNEFALPYSYFSKIIKELNPNIDGYTKYRAVMRDLKNEYFDVFIKGYYYPEFGIWEYTYYTEKQALKDLFFKVEHSVSNGFAKINISKLAKQTIGVVLKPTYRYRNEEYTDINECCKRYFIPGTGITEYNRIKHDIKENSSVSYKLITGLDCCIARTDNSPIKYAPLETEYQYKFNTLIDKDLVATIAKMDLVKEKDTDNGKIIRTCRELTRNANDDGTVPLYYHEANYGRLCLRGNNLQLMKKEYRNEILKYYTCVDMDGSFFALLNNYIKLNGYKKETPFLDRFCSNSKEYRHKVHEDLLKDDPTVEYEDVKRCFTAMGYGACVSVSQVSSAIHFNKPNILIDNVGKNNKYTAERLASHPDFKGLYEELSAIRKFIGKKIRAEAKKSGKNELTNLAGRVINLQEIPPKKLTIAIVTFLIHGMEVTTLKEVARFIQEKNPDDPNPIGLLLHDGIYIENECMKGITTDMISEHIFKTLNFSLKYSVEQ